MNEGTRETQSGAIGEWKVRLECGHEISVPWGSQTPAAMAYIVQHRDHCEPPSPDLSGGAWWAVPLGPVPRVAFR